jgi:hypothetical protein
MNFQRDIRQVNEFTKDLVTERKREKGNTSKENIFELANLNVKTTLATRRSDDIPQHGL